MLEVGRIITQFPHCDQRVLHAPGECMVCDERPEWQELRIAWGIAFTGHPRLDTQLPCPADVARPRGSTSDHQLWGGNTPRPAGDTYGDAFQLVATPQDVDRIKAEQAQPRPGFSIWARLRRGR